MRVVTPGFHARVYAAVRRVPRGRVSTYGRIAELLGSSRVARHVGWALAALPSAKRVPWHRVINSAGRISHGDPARAVTQRRLLEREGIDFDARDRVDLRRYGWPARRKRTLT